MASQTSTQETVAEFTTRAASFVEQSKADGVACPAFGAIMPPALHDPARAWQRHMYANGFAGVAWPTEYGGQGLTGDHGIAWSEECARQGVAPYMNFQGFVLAGGAILKYGTDDQKQRYLQPTLAADIVWCQLFSEPGSGSDLASLSTRAEATGDGWLVTGQKVWSSTAQLSDHGILMARTDPDEPRHKGISFFLFDMHGEGVDVRPLKQMTGDQEFCEVFLDEAPVAANDLLGPAGSGWAVATSVLADERSEVGSQSIGLVRRINQLADRVDTTDPHMRDRVMQLMVEGGAVRHLLARSAGDPNLGPLVKLGRTSFDVGRSRCEVDAMGPAGTGNDAIIDEFLYAPGMAIAGGTSEIQRNLVGERLLGLPREPKPK